ncbi:MAG: carbohydrate binding domain-containing protein [Kiritimatiellae bacterium]|nr:carbohydrate binding domain-containing protein [Kiritimatiellia bacterium]
MKGMLLLAVVLVTGFLKAAMVENPSFETIAADGGVDGWSWWSREAGKGGVEVSGDAPSGARSVRVRHDGERDWAYSNSRKTPVKPGESYEVSVWIKGVEGYKAGSLTVTGTRDGKVVSWEIGTASGRFSAQWQKFIGFFEVPEGVDTVYVRLVGSGKTDFLVDDVYLAPGRLELPPKGPKVAGWAQERPEEQIGRGLVAVETADGTYLSWRLLEGDNSGIAFDVYREIEGQRQRLNTVPIRQATDFRDAGFFNATAAYTVEPSAGFGGATQCIRPVALAGSKLPYICIPLAATNVTAQKVGIGDIDGDGVYDYLIKQPGQNIDPWHKYWHRSPDTFKIEARRHDGTLLWIKDLGWSIERGMWYSPMIVCDLNGNGRAEVVLKIGPDEDMRDGDGRVQAGPEWVAVLDGLTGLEIARAPWPPRDKLEDYNRSSRNQLAVAYLDGKTPCLLVLRGTYGVMLADAWQLKNSKLEKLWSFSNEDLPREYRGQGAHSCLCADVDGDGRDEVILGSLVLDDDGSVLWTSGKGHPDAHYYGDIDPVRPGMELAYIIETRQSVGGGIHLLDPVDGSMIWQLQEPTVHVHGRGMCSDIDVIHPGLEIYGADCDAHKLTERRWLFSSDGRIMKSGKEVNFKFGALSAWWDADLQRELILGNRMADYEGGSVSENMEGSVLAVADVLGDWREEIFTTMPGELRIYTTSVLAMDRRICLMQNKAYRMRVMMNAMGYYQAPILSYVPEARSPNLNLTLMRDGKQQLCRTVVVAPFDTDVKGKVTLTAPAGIELSRTEWDVDIAHGARSAEAVKVTGSLKRRGDSIRATFVRQDGRVLQGAVPLGL